MKIGYACINLSLESEGSFRKMTAKKASCMSRSELDRQLKEITLHNLNNTHKIMQWGVKNDVYMYRMTSELIPLATHSFNTWDWANDIDVQNACDKIKKFVALYGMRISMHPSQYCVLNSFTKTVVDSSIADLLHHNTLSNMLGNKTLILHVGGVYENKAKAIDNFIHNFNLLPNDLQSKIVLENDDKSYNVDEVLGICKTIGIPMCLDYHHDRCLPSKKHITDSINRIKATWKGAVPKLHLSTGRYSTKDRKHADYVDILDFDQVCAITSGKFDIMLEAKAKDLAVLSLR